jgi:hypothetical protein
VEEGEVRGAVRPQQQPLREIETLEGMGEKIVDEHGRDELQIREEPMMNLMTS